jgi:hypothetical protein
MAARGGRRPGAGRKKRQPLPQTSTASRGHLAWLLEQLNRPAKASDSFEVQEWRKLTEAADVNCRGQNRRYLTDHVYGKPVQMIAHGDPDGGPVQIEVTLKRVGS